MREFISLQALFICLVYVSSACAFLSLVLLYPTIHRVGILYVLRDIILFNDVFKSLLTCPSTFDAEMEYIEVENEDCENIELDEFYM